MNKLKYQLNVSDLNIFCSYTENKLNEIKALHIVDRITIKMCIHKIKNKLFTIYKQKNIKISLDLNDCKALNNFYDLIKFTGTRVIDENIFAFSIFSIIFVQYYNYCDNLINEYNRLNKIDTTAYLW